MAGNIGVLQLIAEFFGILRGRELSTIRQFAVGLHEFAIEGLPDPVSSDEEDYGTDDDSGDY